MELGLIDSIGDYYSVMKKKFGKEIKFRDFSKKQSWFKQKFFSSSSSQDIVDNLFERIDEKLIWSKYEL